MIEIEISILSFYYFLAGISNDQTALNTTVALRANLRFEI